MKVLLLRPPIWYIDLSTGSFSFGLYTMLMTRYPPMGLLYTASILRRDGHRVILVDAEAEELEIPSVLARVRPFAPDLVVGTVNIYNSYRNFEDLIALKRALNVPLVVRGHFPRHYPDETMERREVDAAATGKGWSAVRDLVAAMEEGRDLATVAGIRYRRDGQIVETGPEEPWRNLDDLPFPARDLLDHRLYGTNLSYRRPFTTAFGSFGCPFQCTYCQDRHVRYQFRSAESVVEELVECVRKYGIREVAFLDPTFTVRRAWVLELCERLIARGLDLTFTMRTRADLVDAEMVRALRRAGCVRVSFGIESGDPAILSNLHRTMDPAATREAVRLAAREGIMTFGYFMIGNKGESAESLARTLELIKELPMHFAQFFQTIPLPGTEALEDTRRALGVDPWREINYGRYPSRESFAPQDIRISREELNRWTRRFYVQMFLHPARWRALLSLRFLPAYVLRQSQILVLAVRLLALRRIRRRWPDFRLAVYPEARNGGPGDFS